MKKVLFAFIILFCAFSLNAQTTPSPEEFSSLTQKVDSLEKKFTFLNLSFEIYSLRNDIISSACNMDTKALDIQLNMYTGNASPDFKKAYNAYYESCLGQEKSYSDLIEVKKNFIASQVVSNEFSESELALILGEINAVDAAFDSFKSSINVLSALMKVYNQLY